MSRALATALLLPQAAVAAAAAPLQLKLMTDAAADGAVCLDGSPGGYYLRKGTSDQWIVFHEGGGWCWSTGVCFSRAQMDLGSSKGWPTEIDEGKTEFNMFFDSFADHNVVYAKYCDGGSWTGNATDVWDNEDPTKGPVGNTTIYYRGRLLLDSMLTELRDLGMGRPGSQIIYGGCSAGGLTSATHVDYVASLFPDATVLGLTDAMFSLERPNAAGVSPSYLNRMMDFGFTAWNSAASVNQGCLEHYVAAAGGNISAGVHCLYGANVAPFVQTSMFYMQSKYDTWQGKALLEVNCDVGKCNATEEAAWIQLGNEMVAAVQALPVRHGAWFTNCPAHCQSGAPLGKQVVNNVSNDEAFVAWVNSNHSEPAPRWLPTCNEFPCAGTDACFR